MKRHKTDEGGFGVNESRSLVRPSIHPSIDNGSYCIIGYIHATIVDRLQLALIKERRAVTWHDMTWHVLYASNLLKTRQDERFIYLLASNKNITVLYVRTYVRIPPKRGTRARMICWSTRLLYVYWNWGTAYLLNMYVWLTDVTRCYKKTDTWTNQWMNQSCVRGWIGWGIVCIQSIVE